MEPAAISLEHEYSNCFNPRGGVLLLIESAGWQILHGKSAAESEKNPGISLRPRASSISKQRRQSFPHREFVSRILGEYTFGYQLLEDQEFTGKLLSMRSVRSNAHFVPRIALCSTIYT